MVVCAYFQQGRCKYGDRCKYEHPGQPTLGSGNRFGVLQNSSQDSSAFGDRWPSQHKPPGKQQNFGVNPEDIKTDLAVGKGRPEWIFSAYAPNKNVPRQLFGGPLREQSFEEMRIRHYQAAATGNHDQAVQEASSLYTESLRQMEAALSDPDGAVKYIIDGDNEHPNRIDVTEGRTTAFNTGIAPIPGAAVSQVSAPSFGQPSPMGGQNPALGAPSLSQQSAFGQAPAFSQPSPLGAGMQTSTFGKPSALGGQPAFGKPALGQPTFGQPSALGAPTFGKQNAASPFAALFEQNNGRSVFQQPTGGAPALSQPSAASVFGQPPSKPTNTISPFGQLAGQTGGVSLFGQPSTAGGSPGGFGQPSGVSSPFAQAQQNVSPFAQPTPIETTTAGFGQQPQAASPFIELQKRENPFGKPSAEGTTGVFGQKPSVFAQAPQSAGPFGQPSSVPASFSGAPSQQTTTTPFGQPATITTAAAPSTSSKLPLGPKPILKVGNGGLNPFPDLSGPTKHDPTTEKLTMWKGRAVKYIEDFPCYLHPDDSNTYVRIFFPDGPPERSSLRDTEAKPEAYTPEISEMYEFFLKNGYFKDGIMPSIPPKTAWVSFDF